VTARLVAAVLAASALRLLLAWRLGLAADEAYYWGWSERLAWGYYDHPPAVAGVIRAGTALLGDTELGVRAAGVLLQAGAAWALLREGGDRWLLALMLLTAPLLALGGLLATPDVPLLAAWALGLAAASRGRVWLVGLCCGAAMLSKLTGWLLWPIVWLAWDKRDWRIYAAGALAVCVASPNLIWNAQNGWVAYGFQLRHGLVAAEAEAPGLAGLATYLGGQLGLLNPLLAAAVGGWLWRGPRDLWCFAAAAPWLAFAAASCVGHSEPNWPAAAFLGAFVGLSRQGGWVRRAAWAGAWMGCITSALVALHALRPLIHWRADPTHELRMGAVIGPAAAAADRPGPVLCERYQEASWIRFYGGVDATTAPGVGRVDQHDLWPRELPEEGLFVRPYRGAPTLPVDGLYRGHGAAEVVELRVGPQRVKRWQIYRISGYQGER